MKDRVFFDTNIFVYLWGGEDPGKAEISDRLVAEALKHRCGVISIQVAQEFFNVVFKKYKPGLSPELAEQFSGNMFARLDCVPSSLALTLEAVRLRERHKLEWWDSLIVAAAIAAECDVLYTEDFQHGRQFGGLRIVNPFFAHKN